MMNDREFEESLKGVFEENFEENGSSAEIDIEKLLKSAYREAVIEKDKKDKTDRKRKRIKRIRAAVIFVAIIIASLAVFAPEQGYADIFRFMADKVGASGDVVQDNLIGDETDKLNNELIKLENLDEKLGFHVILSDYINNNYEIPKEAQIVKSDNKIVSVIMQYYNYIEEKYVLYKIMNIDEKKCISAVMDIPEKYVEVIKKNEGTEYFYYMDKESMNGRVYWQEGEYLYYFDGNISKEDALNIVETLK